MLYVVSDEIIPETHSRGFELEGTWGLIILESLYLEALERLVAAHESLSRPEEALHYAGLLLACDPLREDLYRVTIRLHMRLGNRAEAVRQAWRCRAVLQAELGIEPEPETVALCDELLGSTWRRESGRETLTQRGPLPRSQPTLILEHPPFVGREAAWRTLLAHWERAQSGQGCLVLVSGEAGIGKSRLVRELGQYVRQRGDWVAYARCYEYERAAPRPIGGPAAGCSPPGGRCCLGTSPLLAGYGTDPPGPRTG